MVLESLSNPFKAENKPSTLILVGFLYCTVALFLAVWIFKDQASLVFVFLTVMAAIPLMFNIIKEEEKKDLKDYKEIKLLKEHSKALYAFMALFLGITLSIVLWYSVLPAEMNESLFHTQINTIKEINGRVTGLSTVSSSAAFSRIFFNNIKVLIFCILFSFLYGSGAIFVLTWNASVIGTAIGNFIRNNLAAVAHLAGFEKVGEYFTVITIGLTRYVIHGVPEILGYFVAALAGGIISIGVIKHDFEGRKFEHIVLDAADLILLAIGIIFVAAILEVWVTPLIF